jgi:Fe-Mn family superoxide dismutase
MAFELPDLPYAHDALADLGMSRETLEYHHDLHHKAYVDNGNKLIEGTEWAGKSLEDIITGTYQAGAVAQNGIFNNASQHWNHMQFWEMMGPGTGGCPVSWKAPSWKASARSTSSSRSSPPRARDSSARAGAGW